MNIKHGDWLFTCHMEPQQFDKWLNQDSFQTINGSHHSKSNCSLTSISEEYAKFFIENKCWEFYDEMDKSSDIWNNYINKVKELKK